MVKEPNSPAFSTVRRTYWTICHNVFPLSVFSCFVHKPQPPSTILINFFLQPSNVLYVFVSPPSHRVNVAGEFLLFGTHISVVVPFIQLFPAFDGPVFSCVRFLCPIFCDVFHLLDL